MLALAISSSAFAVPALNSYPSASATIYLDFDGQTVTGTYWNSNSLQSIVCAPSGMTDAQIMEIFKRVSEDYRPFNVNITTEESVFTSAPLNRRIRVIITPTSSWRSGVGGIAYVGSFTWGDDTPCFVFNDRLGFNPKYVAECCSHESGHTLGLSHQSTYNSSCQLVEPYASGVGSGETSWAPIMGNSYYKNMTGWEYGPTQYGCTINQDNLTILTTQNGFTYRTDDHPNDLTGNQWNTYSNSFSFDGLIATNTDKDAFRFEVTQSAEFHFEAIPYSINVYNNGANLDIKLELYDANKVLLKSFDPANKMSVVVDTTLNSGIYYFVLTGTGNANTDDYGSIGSYTFMALRGVLPIRDISLTGNSFDGRHDLNWRVTADEPLEFQSIEVSADGADFTTLYEPGAQAQSYSYTPASNSNIYYRIKARTINDQTAYSNVIVLRATGNPTKKFFVSTLVSESIAVNASENFSYRLADMNGRILATGSGLRGMNRINMMNKPGGMYLLQIISNNQLTTERIIKQ